MARTRRSASTRSTRRPARRSRPRTRRTRKFSLAQVLGLPTLEDIEKTVDVADALNIPGADPISNALFAFRVIRFLRRRSPAARVDAPRLSPVDAAEAEALRRARTQAVLHLAWRLIRLAFWLAVGVLWIAYLWGATLLSVLIHGKRRTLAKVLPVLTGQPEPAPRVNP